jgi:hypothetical protein
MSQVLQWTQFWKLIWKVASAALAQHLVDPGRAVALRRFGIFGQVDRNRDRRVLQLQVGGLALVMVGEAEGHVGQPVEGQLAVGPRIVDLLEVLRLAGGRRRTCRGAACRRRSGRQVFSHMSSAAAHQAGDQAKRDHSGLTLRTFFRSLPMGPLRTSVS